MRRIVLVALAVASLAALGLVSVYAAPAETPAAKPAAPAAKADDVYAGKVKSCTGEDVAALVMEVTDDKSLPKAERKRLQIVHASQISVRAQVIKLADKISNLRGILASPPTDWSEERQREYSEWAKQVVDGLSAPNQMLKAEFECLYRQAGSLASS